MSGQRPFEPHERARYDQDQAELDHLIGHAREHRREYCIYADLHCVGESLSHYLQHLSRHDLVVVAISCIARLADLPAKPTTIEGISE